VGQAWQEVRDNKEMIEHAFRSVEYQFQLIRAWILPSKYMNLHNITDAQDFEGSDDERSLNLTLVILTGYS